MHKKYGKFADAPQEERRRASGPDPAGSADTTRCAGCRVARELRRPPHRVPQRRQGRRWRPVTQWSSPGRRAGGHLVGLRTVAEWLQHGRGPLDQAATSTSPTGVHGLTPVTNASSLTQRLPSPATSAGRAARSPAARSGRPTSRRTASSASQSSRNGSGPRWPTRRPRRRWAPARPRGSRSRARRRSSRASTTRTSGISRPAAACPARHGPLAVHAQVAVQRDRRRVTQNRVSRCLPWVTWPTCARQVAGGEPRHPEVGAPTPPAGQPAVEPAGEPPDAVTLGHAPILPARR